MTARLADELPFLIQSVGDSQQLRECLSNLCVFRLLYTRGRCSELLDFWSWVGVDRQGVASIYFDTVKKVEEGNDNSPHNLLVKVPKGCFRRKT